MATLWIREYSTAGEARLPGSGARGKAGLPIPMEPGHDQEPLIFSSGPQGSPPMDAQSAAFRGTTHYIAIEADEDFHYVVGENPEPTTNGPPVPASETRFIGVLPGHKIAVVTVS